MNKVILLGRFTKDPEIKNSGKENIFSRFTIAVNRPYKKEGEQEADFINCVAFGKSGEFAQKFLKKGQLISITGRIQTGVYEKDGKKYYTTDVIVEEHYFTGKADGKTSEAEGFVPIDESVEEDDLPF